MEGALALTARRVAEARSAASDFGRGSPRQARDRLTGAGLPDDVAARKLRPLDQSTQYTPPSPATTPHD
jgi:hypothetical protein